ncbi:MAG: N-acetylneuraminate synthase family protein [Halobacteriota archaeon]
MKTVKIGNRIVGGDGLCYIIAEAGSNHNGSLEQAKKLIDVAAEAKADAVKFQLFKAERLSADKEIHELLKKFEFRREWVKELSEYAKGKSIMFLATPFDTEAVDLLGKIDIPVFKVASGDLTNLPLIEYIAEKGKSIILSVGLGSLDEIRETLNVIYSTGNENVALLHCVASYPTKPEEVNLKVIKTLKQRFELPVGFSDHTMEVSIPIGAVALGANIIEKHFTIDRKLEGPDHPYALEPEELKILVKGIRDVEKALGSGIKNIVDSEMQGLVEGRRSIFAKVNISEGTTITKDMLSILRPARGIAPKYIDNIIGKKVKKDIKAYESITWDKIEI